MCDRVLLWSGQVLTPGSCPAGRRGWAELPCFPTQEGEAHRRGEWGWRRGQPGQGLGESSLLGRFWESTEPRPWSCRLGPRKASGSLTSTRSPGACAAVGEQSFESAETQQPHGLDALLWGFSEGEVRNLATAFLSCGGSRAVAHGEGNHTPSWMHWSGAGAGWPLGSYDFTGTAGASRRDGEALSGEAGWALTWSPRLASSAWLPQTSSVFLSMEVLSPINNFVTSFILSVNDGELLHILEGLIVKEEQNLDPMEGNIEGSNKKTWTPACSV